MHPRLFSLPFELPGVGGSYFTAVAIGFVIAGILIRRFAKFHGIDVRLMTDFAIWMLVCGVIGARLLHVIADGKFWDYVNLCRDPSLVDWKVDVRECRTLQGVWDAAKGVCHPIHQNCFAWADVTAGGLAFYGGFVASTLFAVGFVRRHRLPAGKILDLGAWTLMLALAWGRIGCFLAGCCFGVVAKLPTGVVFPSGSPASRAHWDHGWLKSYRLPSLPVLPTQIYYSLAVLLIAAIAYFWWRPRQKFDGQVFCLTAGTYAVFRFGIEFFRADERGQWGGLSTSQLFAAVFLVVCVYFYGVFKHKAAQQAQKLGL